MKSRCKPVFSRQDTPFRAIIKPKRCDCLHPRCCLRERAVSNDAAKIVRGQLLDFPKKIKKFPKRESWFVSCSRDNLNIISLYFRAPVPSCIHKSTGVAMQNLGFKTAGSPDGALNACDDARGVPSRPLTVKDRDTTHITAKRTAVTTPLTQ